MLVRLMNYICIHLATEIRSGKLTQFGQTSLAAKVSATEQYFNVQFVHSPFGIASIHNTWLYLI